MRGAERTNEQVLEWNKAVLAAKHTSTLSATCNLSHPYRNQGEVNKIDDLEQGAHAFGTRFSSRNVRNEACHALYCSKSHDCCAVALARSLRHSSHYSHHTHDLCVTPLS